MDEAATKEELRPVKAALVRPDLTCGVPLTLREFTSTDAWKPPLTLDPQKQLKNDTETLPREQKVAVLKECLTVIGARIEAVVAVKKAKGEDADKSVHRLTTSMPPATTYGR